MKQLCEVVGLGRNFSSEPSSSGRSTQSGYERFGIDPSCPKCKKKKERSKKECPLPKKRKIGSGSPKKHRNQASKPPWSQGPHARGG